YVVKRGGGFGGRRGVADQRGFAEQAFGAHDASDGLPTFRCEVRDLHAPENYKMQVLARVLAIVNRPTLSYFLDSLSRKVCEWIFIRKAGLAIHEEAPLLYRRSSPTGTILR